MTRVPAVPSPLQQQLAKAMTKKKKRSVARCEYNWCFSLQKRSWLGKRWILVPAIARTMGSGCEFQQRKFILVIRNSSLRTSELLYRDLNWLWSLCPLRYPKSPGQGCKQPDLLLKVTLHFEWVVEQESPRGSFQSELFPDSV